MYLLSSGTLDGYKVKWVKSLSHVWLCYPMDGSPSGSSIYGIFQARILEWVAISSSRGSSGPKDWTCISCNAGWFLTAEPPGKSWRWFASIILRLISIPLLVSGLSVLFYFVSLDLALSGVREGCWVNTLEKELNTGERSPDSQGHCPQGFLKTFAKWEETSSPKWI